MVYVGGVVLNCIVNVKLSFVGWCDVFVYFVVIDDGNVVGLVYYG